MKSKLAGGLLVRVALVLTLSISASPARNAQSREPDVKSPVRLIGVIPIPGNPLVTSDIIWADPGTRRLYVTDRSNFGLDIFDAVKDVFVGRVTGFAGPEISRGDPNANATVPPPNGEGPSGVLVTPNKKVWAGDGNSTVKVADVDPNSPSYLKIIQSISTAIPECGSHCDRADEIAYDPADHIIAVANNQPLTATPTTPPTRGNPYATFINADTYRVLGHVTFEGATGLEQPLWVPEQRRFFITVTGYRNNGGSNGGFGELAVIDPKSMKVEKSLNPGKCHPSAEALGPSQHILLSCGAPVVLSATDGTIISTITQIGAGDENWYNPGDGRFYFTGNDKSAPPVTSLGVVDAQTGAWLQNVPDPGGRQAAALAENNHIFTLVRVTAAIVKDPSSDKTVCAQFGIKGRGCIAVFGHSEEVAQIGASPAAAATYPAPVEADHIIRNFRFATGEVLPELRIHYRTIGTPQRDSAGVVQNAVLILHGTSATSAGFLEPAFAGQLFERGQLLDGNTHFIILPDAIGVGQSSKPSDGLHAKFPRYTYADMIEAQHRLLTEKLGVTHLRLLLGTSMGAMHTWMWGETYPDFMDALMPLASNPVPIGGRNRVYRKMIIDSIRNDPEWKNGEYKTQPHGLVAALEISMLAISSALQWQKQYPTGAAADKYLHDQVQTALATADANDTLYRYDASRDYDPSAKLESIKAPLLALNSADDLINPPELGIMEREIKRVKRGRFVLVPVSDQTRGHGTHSIPVVWQRYLAELLTESSK